MAIKFPPTTPALPLGTLVDGGRGVVVGPDNEIEWMRGSDGKAFVDLNVAEVECLAKAGVKIELSGPVRVQSVPQVWQTPPVQSGSPEHLVSMARDRWRMSMEAKYNDRNLAPTFYNDPLISAVRHGDKVYIFARGEGEPEIIVDDVCVYPSDALMAKLHLMMEHGK